MRSAHILTGFACLATTVTAAPTPENDATATEARWISNLPYTKGAPLFTHRLLPFKTAISPSSNRATPTPLNEAVPEVNAAVESSICLADNDLCNPHAGNIETMPKSKEPGARNKPGRMTTVALTLPHPHFTAVDVEDTPCGPDAGRPCLRASETSAPAPTSKPTDLSAHLPEGAEDEWTWPYHLPPECSGNGAKIGPCLARRDAGDHRVLPVQHAGVDIDALRQLKKLYGEINPDMVKAAIAERMRQNEVGKDRELLERMKLYEEINLDMVKAFIAELMRQELDEEINPEVLKAVVNLDIFRCGRTGC